MLGGVTRERFESDQFVQLSVERLLLNIGEAARRVSIELRNNHPEIPWAQIIAQRNVLVHEYGEIRPELVWLTAVRDVPELLRRLEPLIPNQPDDEP